MSFGGALDTLCSLVDFSLHVRNGSPPARLEEKELHAINTKIEKVLGCLSSLTDEERRRCRECKCEEWTMTTLLFFIERALACSEVLRRSQKWSSCLYNSYACLDWLLLWSKQTDTTTPEEGLEEVWESAVPRMAGLAVSGTDEIWKGLPLLAESAAVNEHLDAADSAFVLLLRLHVRFAPQMAAFWYAETLERPYLAGRLERWALWRNEVPKAFDTADLRTARFGHSAAASALATALDVFDILRKTYDAEAKEDVGGRLVVRVCDFLAQKGNVLPLTRLLLCKRRLGTVLEASLSLPTHVKMELAGGLSKKVANMEETEDVRSLKVYVELLLIFMQDSDKRILQRALAFGLLSSPLFTIQNEALLMTRSDEDASWLLASKNKILSLFKVDFSGNDIIRACLLPS